jgi:hypothetical protein
LYICKKVTMDFVRGVDPKQSLGIGLGKEIKTQMSRSTEFSYDDFFEVWQWALEKHKFHVFPYLIQMNGKKWVNGEKIEISDANNELLWRSIEAKNIAAVKAILTIPGLFRKETLVLEPGTAELEGEYTYRGEDKFPMRATNLGSFLNLSITSCPNKEIENLLRNYYDDEFRKGS